MNVGSFGDIVFAVSDSDIFTFNGQDREYKAVFAAHEVVDGKPKLQHMGSDLETFSLRVRLDGRWCDPEARIQALNAVVVAGEAATLLLGGRRHGTFVLESVSVSASTHDGAGRILHADLTLAFKEYA